MQLRFIGCGDAFGSGGRFNTCFQVISPSATVLIDCGASSLVALRKWGVDPNSIDAVFITHLHGDHFGGLPFLILDAQLVSRRTRPLTIAGPPGLRERLTQAMEVFFPGSSGVTQKFTLEVIELQPDAQTTVGAVSVLPMKVRHPCGAPPLALRLTIDGKSVAYTGDTEWTEALIAVAQDADLFIAEAYFHDRKVKYHLDLDTVLAHMAQLRPRRMVLTHMSPDMLGRDLAGRFEVAEDGMLLEV
ncbi:MAG: MBL fold metallo-hydrolase [Alphaproteobacteria bacterium]|nr:MBL fold metallo-hydrolase [Alphaproteobacteria bacterium]